jgi:hypothetical protein
MGGRYRFLAAGCGLNECSQRAKLSGEPNLFKLSNPNAPWQVCNVDDFSEIIYERSSAAQ